MDQHQRRNARGQREILRGVKIVYQVGKAVAQGERQSHREQAAADKSAKGLFERLLG